MLSTHIGLEKSVKKIKLKKVALKPAAQKLFAIIDLGTNSVRLDVYRKNGAQLYRIYRGKNMIRLGDGVFRTGQISKMVMDRTLTLFVSIRKSLNAMGITEVHAIGTSALRSAKNSKEFLQMIFRRTGIQVRIISGNEEAQLIAAGILMNIDPPKGKYALIDIGGGSTEVSICQNRRVIKSWSFRLGANRLNQMFYKEGNTKTPTHDSELDLRKYVRGQLKELEPLVKKHSIGVAIGSSGTIRAVGKLLKKMGCKTTPAISYDVSALVGEIKNMNKSEILNLPGLESKRADLIIPGSILIEEILHALRCKKLKFTEFALRDGLLYNVLDQL
jgi:exopolyphosphatase/guanosine-5'-triphosphate,3'-diphosphate pyrophosphatase